MKKILLGLLAVFALAPGVLARDDYSINKISPALVQTPNIQFQGTPKPAVSPRQWLEVEVEFRSNIETTEEMTLKYFVYLGPLKKCLTGTVTHVDVPKGNNLLSVMYLSPRAIARLTGGKNFNMADVQEVAVQILVKDQPVAQKSMKGTPGEWWATDKVEKISGLLNKNQTPFSPLYPDRYEAIKSESH
jgi:hypothetical protein